jgi:hypothetical protein
MWHVCETGEVHIGFLWAHLREEDQLKDSFRWQQNTENNFPEEGWGDMCSMYVVQDRERWP